MVNSVFHEGNAPEYLMRLHELCKDLRPFQLERMRSYINSQLTWRSEGDRLRGMSDADRALMQAEMPHKFDIPVEGEIDAVSDHHFANTAWVHNVDGAKRIPVAQLDEYLANGYAKGKKPEHLRKPAYVPTGVGRGKGLKNKKFMFLGNVVKSVPINEVEHYKRLGYKLGKKPF